MSKSTCADGDVSRGRLQILTMTLGLFKTMSEEEDDPNIFLVPLELGRIVSALVQSTSDRSEKLRQIQCFDDHAEARLRRMADGGGDTATKMMAMNRRLFLDKTLDVTPTNETKNLCWHRNN